MTFPDGLPGFEACRRFVLVARDRARAVHGRAGARRRDAAGVRRHRPAARRAGLRQRCSRGSISAARRRGGAAAALARARRVAAPDGRATVNLRAPLVINPRSMRGIQLRLDRQPPMRSITHCLAAGRAVLVFTRKLDEGIIIGDGIEVRVLRVGRTSVRLGVIAAPHVPVAPREIYDQIRAVNRLPLRRIRETAAEVAARLRRARRGRSRHDVDVDGPQVRRLAVAADRYGRAVARRRGHALARWASAGTCASVRVPSSLRVRRVVCLDLSCATRPGDRADGSWFLDHRGTLQGPRSSLIRRSHRHARLPHRGGVHDAGDADSGGLRARRGAACVLLTCRAVRRRDVSLPPARPRSCAVDGGSPVGRGIWPTSALRASCAPARTADLRRSARALLRPARTANPAGRHDEPRVRRGAAADASSRTRDLRRNMPRRQWRAPRRHHDDRSSASRARTSRSSSSILLRAAAGSRGACSTPRSDDARAGFKRLTLLVAETNARAAGSTEALGFSDRSGSSSPCGASRASSRRVAMDLVGARKAVGQAFRAAQRVR